MFPFVVLLLVPMMMQHIRVRGLSYQKKNKNALLFFFVVYTLLIALRHERIGTDTSDYMKYFEQYARMDWNKIRNIPYEQGFVYFNKLVSFMSGEPQFYLTVVAVVTSVMIYPTYRRLHKDTSLTIVLFCVISTFVMSFSGIRQMIAIAMGVVAYEFTRKKQLLPFILMVLLAISFHSSAFILAFMYPLYHARITKKWLIVVIPIMAVAFALNEPIFSVLSLVLERYTRFESEISNTGAYTMLILFSMFAVIAFLFPDERKLSKEVIGLRNFLLLSVLIQMFAPLHTLAMRMNYYFIIFIPLLMPQIIQASSERWRQVALTARHVMVVFFLLYFFWSASKGGNLDVFPYHFFWENV